MAYNTFVFAVLSIFSLLQDMKGDSIKYTKMLCLIITSFSLAT